MAKAWSRVGRVAVATSAFVLAGCGTAGVEETEVACETPGQEATFEVDDPATLARLEVIRVFEQGQCGDGKPAMVRVEDKDLRPVDGEVTIKCPAVTCDGQPGLVPGASIVFVLR